MKKNMASALVRIHQLADHPRANRIKRKMRALRAEVACRLGRDTFVVPLAHLDVPRDGPFLWKASFIDQVRQTAATDARRTAAIAHVTEAARSALAGGCYSVTHKLWFPPSGDKHDYYSGGAYWWPAEGAFEGAPWLFRDGHMNPVRFGDEYDLTRLDCFAEATKMLALAYRFTGERIFAERAATLIRMWFLDSATRMTPHLAYAQIVPGATKVTGTGIIETLRLVAVIDAIGLVTNSNTLSATEIDGVRNWVAQYAHWLRTSPNGRLECATNNNHGLSYDIQQMSYALFTGDLATARAVAKAIPKSRVYSQIRANGSLPEEARRKEAFFYVAYGLGFFFDVASLAERVGVDLWRYRSRDGTGIEPAFRALMRHADGREPWTGRGARVPNPEMYALALRGAWAYDDPAMGALADSYAARLPLQPVDWTIPRYAARG